MLKFIQSPEDEFWKIKMTRYIDDCNSVSELKQVATMLVALASTRQTIIKGLIKDAAETMTKNLENHLEGGIGS